MHPFWEIPELVQALVEILDRQSQARVAPLNNLLWAAATKPLWEKLPSAEPFQVILLDPHLWPSTGLSGSIPASSTTTLKPGDIQFTQLHRFDLYAPLVKHIAQPIDGVDLDLLIKIGLITKKPHPLPNLVDMRVTIDCDNTPWSGIPSILPVDPSTLELFYNPATPYFTPQQERLVVPKATFPSLTTFSLRLSNYISMNKYTCDALSMFIQRHAGTLAKMTLVGVGSIEDVTSPLRSLAALPRLTHLNISWRWNGEGVESFRDGFGTLTTLQARFPSPAFLSCITSPQLETLILNITVDTLQEARTVIERFKNLGSVSLTIWQGIADFDTLRAFVHCQNLKTFSITAMYRDSMLQITSSGLDRLVQAWPNLRSLRIESEDALDTLITLRDLQCLARHCTKLEVLEITVDASETEDAPVDISAANVRDLILGWTAIPFGVNLQAVANFIGDMWPYRERSKSNWEGGNWVDGQDEEKKFMERWSEVWALADRRSKEWREGNVASNVLV